MAMPLQPRVMKRYCVSGRQYDNLEDAAPAAVSAYLDEQMSICPPDMFFMSWTSVTEVSENSLMLTHREDFSKQGKLAFFHSHRMHCGFFQPLVPLGHYCHLRMLIKNFLCVERSSRKRRRLVPEMRTAGASGQQLLSAFWLVEAKRFSSVRLRCAPKAPGGPSCASMNFMSS